MHDSIGFKTKLVQWRIQELADEGDGNPKGEGDAKL